MRNGSPSSAVLARAESQASSTPSFNNAGQSAGALRARVERVTYARADTSLIRHVAYAPVPLCLLLRQPIEEAAAEAAAVQASGRRGGCDLPPGPGIARSRAGGAPSTRLRAARPVVANKGRAGRDRRSPGTLHLLNGGSGVQLSGAAGQRPLPGHRRDRSGSALAALAAWGPGRRGTAPAESSPGSERCPRRASDQDGSRL